jgi:hypothetical protein
LYFVFFVLKPMKPKHSSKVTTTPLDASHNRAGPWSPTKHNAPLPTLNHSKLVLGIDVSENDLILPEITTIRSSGGDMRLYSCAGKTFISRANADSWRRSESMLIVEAAARAATARRIAIATASVSSSLDESTEISSSPRSPPSSPYRLLAAFEKSRNRKVTQSSISSPTIKEAVTHARDILDESKLLDNKGNVTISVLEKEVAELQASLTTKNNSLEELQTILSQKDAALEKSKEREMSLRQELASLTMRFAAVSSIGALRGGGGGSATVGTSSSPLKPSIPSSVAVVPVQTAVKQDNAETILTSVVNGVETVETTQTSQTVPKEEELGSPASSSESSETTPKKSSGRWSKISKLAGSNVLATAATESVSTAEVEAAVAAAVASSPRSFSGGLLKTGSMPSASNSPVLAMLAMASLRAKKIEGGTVVNSPSN